MQKKLGLVLAVVLFAGCVPLFSSCEKELPRDSYTIVGEYFPEERTLVAKQTVTVYNRTQQAFDELRFQTYANAYQKDAKSPPVSPLFVPSAYYDGESYGSFSLLGGEGAEYELTGQDLTVLSARLPQTLYPDECATLTLEYTVALAKVNHRLGVGEHAVNLTHFYPVLCTYGEGGWQEYEYSPLGDPFVVERSDFSLALTLPKEYGVAHGGREKSVTQSQKTTYHIVWEGVRDCALVLGKDMQVQSTQADGVTVNCVRFGGIPSSAGLRAAAESLSYFSKTFAPYPYGQYTIVQSDLCMGGMEYSGLSILSLNLREEEIATVAVHETAHQWWYSLVGSNQVQNAWMDEGLSEYSTALFFGAHPDYGIDGRQYVLRAEKAYRAFFSVYSQLHGEANTQMNRPLSDFSGVYEYENIAYHKGMLLFDRLRESLGDQRFFAGIKRYADRFQGKIASQSDLISCFQGRERGVESLVCSFTEGKAVI